MTKGKKKGRIGLWLSLLFLTLPGAGPAWAQAGGDAFVLSHITPFEPFATLKEGRSEGLAVEILTQAFARAGVKVAFVGVDQDKEQGALAAGKTDALAFCGINPERRERFDFSDPYLVTGGALFVAAPHPPCTDLAELEGKTVATPRKGPLAGPIRQFHPKVDLFTDVKDYQATLEAVLNGKAYAAALNTQVGAVLAQKLYPGRFSLPKRGYLEIPVGVAVLKGQQAELLMRFNEGLKAILEDGTYDRIVARWGVPETTKPPRR